MSTIPRQQRVVADELMPLYAEYIETVGAYRAPLLSFIESCAAHGDMAEVESGLGTIVPALRAIGLAKACCVIESAFTMARPVASALPADVAVLRAEPSTLPLRSDSLSFVVSCDALRWWTDPVRVLREAIRVVAQGGQVFVHDLRRDAPRGIVEMVAMHLWSRPVPGSRRLVEWFLDSCRRAYTCDQVAHIAAQLRPCLVEVHCLTAMTLTLHIIKT
jgi:SAM-dependent methyltransferase